MSEERKLVPYRDLAPMTEAVYTDQAGGKVERWDLPTWGTDEEVTLIKRMRERRRRV